MAAVAIAFCKAILSSSAHRILYDSREESKQVQHVSRLHRVCLFVIDRLFIPFVRISYCKQIKLKYNNVKKTLLTSTNQMTLTCLSDMRRNTVASILPMIDDNW